MARQSILAQELKGPYDTSYAANSADLTFTAAIAADKEAIQLTCPIIVLLHNTGAGARTVTFNSAACAHNRTNDITTYSIGAGEFAAFEFKGHGWKDADGTLHAEAEHAEVKYAVIKKG